MAVQSAFIGVLGVNPNSTDNDEGTVTGRGIGSVGETHANVNTHVLSTSVVGTYNGPHIVYSGIATLVSGTPSQVVITFDDPLPGAITGYVAIAVPVGVTKAIALAGACVSLDGTTLTITGTDTVTTVMHWMVIKIAA